MATTALIPAEQYLKSDYEPDAEYVDGEIEQRPAGEYDHSTWQHAIQQYFTQHAQPWNLRVRCELRVQVSPTRYRVPDVVVFDRSRPIEQILTHPPIAVFEVISPEDTTSRLLIKLDDYEHMGIQNIFVLDPKLERAFRYQSGDLRLSQPTNHSGRLTGSRRLSRYRSPPRLVAPLTTDHTTYATGRPLTQLIAPFPRHCLIAATRHLDRSRAAA